MPPARIGELVSHIEARGLPYLAEWGVGVCRVGIDAADLVGELRTWAREFGGHAVVADAPAEFRADPWGPPPAAAAIMGRMRRAFDPMGILTPTFQPEAV